MIRKCLQISLATLLLIGALGLSQGIAQEKMISNVRTALKSGSSKTFTSYFNDVVELNMEGEKRNVSKIQAEFIFKDFFKNHPPIDFRYIHQGSSKEGMKYTIGKYIYNGGSYRVYMLIKKINGNYRIDTIDFSKE